MQHCASQRWGSFFLRVLGLTCSLGVASLSAPALATPLVANVSGTLDHKGSITIKGSGFGSKGTAAPLAWDDASGSDPTQVWTGAWPNKFGAAYDLTYRGPTRGVNPPHSHDSRFIAGAHAYSNGADAGFNVVLFKHISFKPSYIYASWYQRADSAWVFGGDNNYKSFDYSEGGDPYAHQNWYTAYGPPHPDSNTDGGVQWTINDDAGSLAYPDLNGHNAWWGTGVNPMAGKWSKVEVAVKVTGQSDGYIQVYENGRQLMNYQGPTDRYSGNDRTIGIGGYARIRNPSNWRYFADVYVDTTLARVVLANNPLLSQATIIENQIPVSWSDGSITATVNLGQFGQGQTAYLFVVDGSGAPSSTGYPLAASGTALMPNAPSSVVVQ